MRRIEGWNVAMGCEEGEEAGEVAGDEGVVDDEAEGDGEVDRLRKREARRREDHILMVSKDWLVDGYM